MPTTDTQFQANQRNALLSTAPTTLEGKQVSRLIALKHGILARETVIAHGDH